MREHVVRLARIVDGDSLRGWRKRHTVSLTDELRALAIQLFGFLAPHHRSHEAVPSEPLAQPLQDLLSQRSVHYRRLPPGMRAEFNRQVQTFMTEKTVTPVKARVTSELRLLTATSAVTLTAGWPGHAWDQVSEVLIYPKDFDEEYRFIDANRASGAHGRARPFHFAGQAHPWGVVILSKPSLIRSFADTEDAYHVGIHEFAHLLDLAGSQFDGIPSHLSQKRIDEWTAILSRESARLQAGDSVLDPYGLSHPTELFAVAVEAFFQTPLAVAAVHARLYRFLAEYFNQDPAAWATTAERQTGKLDH